MAIGTLSISSRRQRGRRLKPVALITGLTGDLHVHPVHTNAIQKLREQLELKYAITPQEKQLYTTIKYNYRCS